VARRREPGVMMAAPSRGVGASLPHWLLRAAPPRPPAPPILRPREESMTGGMRLPCLLAHADSDAGRAAHSVQTELIGSIPHFF
jgi:hypothetical protein